MAVDKDTLDSIARTLQKLKSREHTLKVEADATTTDLIEKTFAKFKRDSRRIREAVYLL